MNSTDTNPHKRKSPHTFRGRVTRVADWRGPLTGSGYEPSQLDHVDARREDDGTIVSCYRCDVEELSFREGQQVTVTHADDDTDVILGGYYVQQRVGERGVIEAMIRPWSTAIPAAWYPIVQVWP